jgi:hypothetical protein
MGRSIAILACVLLAVSATTADAKSKGGAKHGNTPAVQTTTAKPGAPKYTCYDKGSKCGNWMQPSVAKKA